MLVACKDASANPLFVLILCSIAMPSLTSEDRNMMLRESFVQYGDEVKARAGTEETRCKVGMFRRGSTAVLQCFDILHPEDYLCIRAALEQQSSKLERSWNNFMNYIRTKVLRNDAVELLDCRYEWYFQKPGDKQWQPITKNFYKDSLNKEALAWKNILGAGSHGKKFKFGNKHELVLANVSKSDVGFYKCTRAASAIEQGAVEKTANVHFVDVFVKRPEAFVVDTDHNGSKHAHYSRMMDRNLGLVRTAAKFGDWSDCNRCAPFPGESVRTIECYLYPNIPLDNLPSEWIHLRFFGPVPCFSSLSPLEIRAQQREAFVITEWRSCSAICSPEDKSDRSRRTRDKFGQLSLAEHLAHGEFALGELLPILQPPVTRQLFEVFSGDTLVLPCIVDSNNTGVYWEAESAGVLSARVLLAKKHHRLLIDGDFNLVLLQAADDDQDEYRCFDKTDKLRAVYHVTVKKSPWEIKLLQLVNVVTKMLCVIVIIILVLSMVSRKQSAMY